MEESKQLTEFKRNKGLFELPRDIIDTMCNNLSIKDQFRFARVCKSAHSSVYERENPIALKDTPWLIGLTDNSSSLFDTTYDDQVISYKIGTRPFKYSELNIVGYSKGWFYVHYSCESLIQLVNLFVDVQIDLPPLSTIVIPKFKCRHPIFAQAFALSLCKSMRPLMIAIADQYGDLALCKINGGSTWKAHEHDCRDKGYYVNLKFYREKLYAMRNKEFQTVDIFEVGYDDLRLFPMRVIEYKNVINLSLLNLVQQVYLVEDSKGDNMFIVMEYQYMYSSNFVFEVFKVVHDGDEFVRMQDLGDQIILLDDWYSEIIDVKDYSPSDIFKGNQIYFKDWFRDRVGIYSLKNRITRWANANKGQQCPHWIFPRCITTVECHCKSH